jgi:hypothetical protein
MEDRQGRLFKFQPEAHDDEREQGRRQGGKQSSQSAGTTPSLSSRNLFSLLIR